MNGLWDILSVAIGISFIFMILSILNSWIQDYIATLFNIRANNLADIMQNLLEPRVKKLNGRKRAVDDRFSVIPDDTDGDIKAKIDNRKSDPEDSDLSNIYIVQEGDTMNSVAKKKKITVEDLKAANPSVTILDLLLPTGETIKISKGSYKVKKNDTLEIVAKKFDISTDKLKEANPNIDFDKLTPGENLTVLNVHYKVQSDDKETLGSIASTFDIKSEHLEKENPKVTLDNLPLKPGDKLHIPELQEQKIGQLEDRSRKIILARLCENPVKTLYSHPIIHSLSKPNQLPDRMPASDFTVALLDLLDDVGRTDGEKKASSPITIKNIIQGIENLEAEEKKVLDGDEASNNFFERITSSIDDKYLPRLAFRLRSLIYTARINANGEDVNIETFQKAVSDWFDNTVARGSLWYKRRMQRIGIICGFILAIALNADTIGISNALWHNAVLRESISQAAEASAQTGQPTGEQAQEQLEELMSIGLPIGWSFDGNPDDPRALPTDIGGWISKIIGLVLTGFAISQGSQIWFDLMNRLLNLRSAGVSSNADEPKEKEKSKQG